MGSAFEVTLENDAYQICHMPLNVTSTLYILLPTILSKGNIFSSKDHELRVLYVGLQCHQNHNSG